MVRQTVVIGAILGILAMIPAAIQAGDEGHNQALIVVRFGEGRSEARCVSFDEPQITGLELLDRSGLALELRVEGMGAIACQIEETGCPAHDCFCQCPGGDNCTYWSYWRKVDGQWRYSSLGAGSTVVQHGTVEGWSWGPGSVVDAIDPPEIEFADYCPAGIQGNDNQDSTSDTGKTDRLPTLVVAGGALTTVAILLYRFVGGRR